LSQQVGQTIAADGVKQAASAASVRRVVKVVAFFIGAGVAMAATGWTLSTSGFADLVHAVLNMGEGYALSMTKEVKGGDGHTHERQVDVFACQWPRPIAQVQQRKCGQRKCG
jgi:hypothetical protein